MRITKHTRTRSPSLHPPPPTPQFWSLSGLLRPWLSAVSVSLSTHSLSNLALCLIYSLGCCCHMLLLSLPNTVSDTHAPTITHTHTHTGLCSSASTFSVRGKKKQKNKKTKKTNMPKRACTHSPLAARLNLPTSVC